MTSSRSTIMFAIAILAVSFFYANVGLTGSAVKTGSRLAYQEIIVSGGGHVVKEGGAWVCPGEDLCSSKFGKGFNRVYDKDYKRCNCVREGGIDLYTRVYGNEDYQNRVRELCIEGKQSLAPWNGESAYRICSSGVWKDRYCQNNWKPIISRQTGQVSCINPWNPEN